MFVKDSLTMKYTNKYSIIYNSIEISTYYSFDHSINFCDDDIILKQKHLYETNQTH